MLSAPGDTIGPNQRPTAPPEPAPFQLGNHATTSERCFAFAHLTMSSKQRRRRLASGRRALRHVDLATAQVQPQLEHQNLLAQARPEDRVDGIAGWMVPDVTRQACRRLRSEMRNDLWTVASGDPAYSSYIIQLCEWEDAGLAASRTPAPLRSLCYGGVDGRGRDYPSDRLS